MNTERRTVVGHAEGPQPQIDALKKWLKVDWRVRRSRSCPSPPALRVAATELPCQLAEASWVAAHGVYAYLHQYRLRISVPFIIRTVIRNASETGLNLDSASMRLDNPNHSTPCGRPSLDWPKGLGTGMAVHRALLL
jgi:hypothetical protein